jgi:hypothetical protein
MPDQNNPTPVSDVPPPPMDIPPANASIPPPFPPEVAPPEGAAPPPDSGSAAPSFDIPPVISQAPKSKGGGKRVIATILGLLVLVGGLGAGIVLVKQQQDIREKAYETECEPGEKINCTTTSGCPGTKTCGTNFKFGSCVDKAGDNCPATCSPGTERNCTTSLGCPGKEGCTSNGTWGGTCFDIADNCPSSLPTCPNTDCNLPTKPAGAIDCKLTGTNTQTVCCPVDKPLYQNGQCVTSTTTTCTGDEYCAQGQICVSGVCVAGTRGTGGGGTVSCATAPTTSSQCKHTDGTTASFTGNCAIYYCPNGLGSNGKCGEEDSGFWLKFGSCASLWNSLGANQCGQIDTVDTNNAYCIPTGQCDSKIVSNSSCSDTPTQPGGPTAQCLNIKAYDTDWNLLSSDQRSTLKPGDTVRFAVAGQTTGGSFDKARFKINGVQRPEVTQKKPGSEEYYDEYTIPEGVTSFTINAQIHHATLGWSE